MWGTIFLKQVYGFDGRVAASIPSIHASIGGIINFMGGSEFSYALVYGVAVIPIALCLGTVGFILALYSSRGKVQMEKGKKVYE